jgi:hypothetical protein
MAVFGRFALALAFGCSALAVASSGSALAATITYTQNTTDFISLPSSAINPTPISTTGTVYAPSNGLNGAQGLIYGSISDVYRSPFEYSYSPGNGPTGWNQDIPRALYSSVQGGASATYDVGTANVLHILWGSPDSYNSLAFYSGIPSVNTFLGSISVAGNSGIVSGSQPLEINTYGHDRMTFTDLSGTFSYVILSSSTNAFEFTNLEASLNVTNLPGTPVPASLPLLTSGLGAFGMMVWRRKRRAARAKVA